MLLDVRGKSVVLDMEKERTIKGIKIKNFNSFMILVA